MSQRSPLGGQLSRAQFYGFDSTGKRIGAIDRSAVGYTLIPVRESPRHALSGGSDTSTEEEAYREGLRQRIAETLSPLEREILRLQRKLVAFVEERKRIPAGELAEWIRGGYTLIPGSEDTEERVNLPPITTVLVVGRVALQVEQLSHAEIAERLGIPVSRSRRLVWSANRKLKAMERSGSGNQEGPL